MGLIQDNILMVFTKINNGKSLMHYICQKNAYIDLKRLLRALKIYYAADKERNYLKLFDIGDDVCLDTPAHLCLIHQSHECFRLLVELGINLNISNARGWTALDLLQKYNPL
jgi:hypothetical protein